MTPDMGGLVDKLACQVLDIAGLSTGASSEMTQTMNSVLSLLSDDCTLQGPANPPLEVFALLYDGCHVAFQRPACSGLHLCKHKFVWHGIHKTGHIASTCRPDSAFDVVTARTGPMFG